MLIKPLTRKPRPASGVLYDGTIDLSDSMVSWVQKYPNQQKLGFEGDSHLVLTGPDGTYDLFEGWWLVLDDMKFHVLTPDEFHENYESKG